MTTNQTPYTYGLLTIQRNPLGNAYMDKNGNVLCNLSITTPDGVQMSGLSVSIDAARFPVLGVAKRIGRNGKPYEGVRVSLKVRDITVSEGPNGEKTWVNLQRATKAKGGFQLIWENKPRAQREVPVEIPAEKAAQDEDTPF